MNGLVVDTKGAVGVIAINQPDRLNAMTGAMFQQLVEVCQSMAEDDAIRAVVLTGRGKAFCAGGDVNDLGESLNVSDREQATSYLRSLMEASRLLHEMPKPTVASINGAAAGAGLSLALACDFRVVSVGAVLTTAFARMGVSGDFGISYFLTHLVGAARARELLMCSPRLGAEAAFSLGLVHNMVPEDLLEEETMSFARNLAEGPTLAFGRMKQNINAVASGLPLNESLTSEAANMIRSLGTHDHLEAAKAFLEKRPPRFGGE